MEQCDCFLQVKYGYHIFSLRRIKGS
jgi:hypothetical protein